MIITNNKILCIWLCCLDCSNKSNKTNWQDVCHLCVVAQVNAISIQGCWQTVNIWCCILNFHNMLFSIIQWRHYVAIAWTQYSQQHIHYTFSSNYIQSKIFISSTKNGITFVNNLSYLNTNTKCSLVVKLITDNFHSTKDDTSANVRMQTDKTGRRNCGWCIPCTSLRMTATGARAMWRNSVKHSMVFWVRRRLMRRSSTQPMTSRPFSTTRSRLYARLQPQRPCLKSHRKRRQRWVNGLLSQLTKLTSKQDMSAGPSPDEVGEGRSRISVTVHHVAVQ